MQDIDKVENYAYSYAEYKLKPDDILKIDISSENPESISAFTTGVSSSSVNYSTEAMILNGYKINNDGDIYFPSIGRLKVVGKSITEVRTLNVPRKNTERMHINVVIKRYFFLPFEPSDFIPSQGPKIATTNIADDVAQPCC